MPFIYIVAESEGDALFYLTCAERVHGTAFEYKFIDSRLGTGIAKARKMMRHMFAAIRNSGGGGPGIFWIAALDNDRAPQHPDGARPFGTLSASDQRKTNRHAELLAEASSHNVSRPGAIAVPVEMIESWVLQALSPGARLDLPAFAEQEAALAIHYYRLNHRSSPPPQLKDLADAAMRKRGCSDWYEFLIEVASQLDAETLAQQSRSFALFLDDLKRWKLT
ncbi:hypothetical protein [Prosthecobacter sp.]|uniref:hypothetical protein n=1 Tax=Prosthecobacter sp. TaxID=1965333 RepID=UPI00248A1EBE|nr:hypothetical protein [Prosthecobacter sp.]MDI1315374.1 hypothetical protein [Prosthecobacter sp.]